TQPQHPQGVFILADKLKLEPISYDDDFILVIVRIQDPGNIGTLLRTAIAVGLKEVILIHGTVDPFTPTAIMDGIGAQFCLKFVYITNLA
ncbi:RNA methyltransferase, partial [Francisella tularensis subsp. holarctica]|uniref:TrmH family RNA methyltransferase n=1 Tax=Francisella tularensis TaxID=263 RepID=UPI002381C961